MKETKAYNIVADLHCHTIASTHAYSTITELAQAARRRGLVAVGCTDHGVAMWDAPKMSYFGNLNNLPKKIEGVRVLQGVEANVTGFDGRLDIPADLLSRMEVVIASMHGGIMPTGSVDECTAAWLAVAENPHVDIIAHSGSPEYAYDYETVLKAFSRNGKAVEINEHSFEVRKSSIQNCRRIAEMCKRLSISIVVGSDSHFHEWVGLFPNCFRMLNEIEFPPKLIVNSSIENMNRFFGKRNIVFE
ncbi:MAG: phosphatase [Clostridiales bacterium]|nr:phosphatase [Clostridiales bacterium]